MKPDRSGQNSTGLPTMISRGACLISGLLLVLTPILGASASPENEPRAHLPGAAASGVRGPTGFSANANLRGPTLEVAQVSAQITLHPDLAVIKQIITLHNPDVATRTTVGIRQRDPAYGDNKVVHTSLPLAAAAWLDGARLPTGNVRIRHLTESDGPRGYEVALDGAFPEGTSELALTIVVQTVSDTREGAGFTRPAAGGWSRLALQMSHYAWDWSPRTDAPDPQFTVQLTTAGGISLDALEPESWTPGARRDTRSVWWRAAPWFVVRYKSGGAVRRARSHDELLRQAELLVAAGGAPSHLTQPARTTPIDRLRPLEPSAEDNAQRARRALIVPATGIVLLLLAGYGYRRRRRRARFRLTK